MFLLCFFHLLKRFGPRLPLVGLLLNFLFVEYFWFVLEPRAPLECRGFRVVFRVVLVVVDLEVENAFVDPVDLAVQVPSVLSELKIIPRLTVPNWPDGIFTRLPIGS